MKVSVARNMSNRLEISSEVGTFKLQISLMSNIERDLVTLLLRQYQAKFQLDPDVVREKGQRDFYLRREKAWDQELSDLNSELEQTRDKVELIPAPDPSKLSEAHETIEDLKYSLKQAAEAKAAEIANHSEEGQVLELR